MWPFKKPEPAPVVEYVPRKKMPRITVHLMDGRTIVHRALNRDISPTGHLTLSGNNDCLIAEYVAGTWMGTSTGPRHIIKGK